MRAAAARTESEVELCNRLREWAERLGFEVYPEVSGWDLVLVVAGGEPRHLASEPWGARKLVESGQQVGIHAKLRGNCDVLLQAAPPQGQLAPGWHYPHLPFVAVPSPGESFVGIAGRLGIGVIDTAPVRKYRWGAPVRAEAADPEVRDWPTHDHAARAMAPLQLPPIASRLIQAGAPSPRVLSAWRVAAIRFVAWARTVDTWTVRDMETRGVGRAWADRWGELVETRTEIRRGRAVRVNVYRLVDDGTRKLPDQGYRDVAAELLAADAQVAGGACPSP